MDFREVNVDVNVNQDQLSTTERFQMYPFIRLAWQFQRHRNDPEIGVFDTHVSHHICWPWDLDMFAELNNGRMLTLYDMGRMPLAGRIGLVKALRANRWGLTIAGSTARYRRRVRAFDRITMKSRGLCWDERFFYIEQSMWLSNGECASHVLYRSAVTDKNGIVDPERIVEAVGYQGEKPAMPDWVSRWVEAEDKRPWPPMSEG